MAMEPDDRTFARSLIRTFNSASANFETVKDLNKCRSFAGIRTCETLTRFPGFEAEIWEHENGAYEARMEYSSWDFAYDKAQEVFETPYDQLTEPQRDYITTLQRQHAREVFDKLKTLLRGYVQPGLEYHDFTDTDLGEEIAYANVAPGAMAKVVFEEEFATLVFYIFGF